MQIFDSGQSISQSLLGTLSGADGKSFANTTRVPFIFTSTRRLRLLGLEDDVKLGTLVQVGDLQTQTKRTAADQQNNELPIIEMIINPNSIGWRQPKRIVKRDVQTGSVFFHFTNTKCVK